jgi:dTDP-4-dehydrorhamnose 3,5-epimerase
MKFHPTPLNGAFTIEFEKRSDERGFFGRAFCEKEFSVVGLSSKFVQINNALSLQKGTLRGMHYQLPESAETKIVRCIRGSLYDVIIDLRPHSPTFCDYFAEVLSEENRLMMYVPKGFAHGLITLEDNTEVFYLSDEFYSPSNERGLRFDDPRFQINWPLQPSVVSEKDKSWPDYDSKYHGINLLRKLP